LSWCELLEGSERDASRPAGGTILRGPRPQHLAVTPASQPQAEARELGVPAKFLSPVFRQRETGDSFTVEQ
jgi:hypothetical protein